MRADRPSLTARAALGIGVNLLLSWGCLPFFLSNARAATLRDFGEVILWQVVALIGWPLAIFWVVLSSLFEPVETGQWQLLFLLIYPALIALCIYLVRCKHFAWWALIAIHGLITASFAAVWWTVLSGYDFMVG